MRFELTAGFAAECGDGITEPLKQVCQGLLMGASRRASPRRNSARGDRPGLASSKAQGNARLQAEPKPQTRAS